MSLWRSFALKPSKLMNIGVIGMEEQTPQMKAYCLNCETGYEASIARMLEYNDFTPITAMTERIIVKNGIKKREERALFPGYVLFEALEFNMDNVASFRRNPHFLKVLSYRNGDYALKGEDLEFVGWLKRRQGMISVSKVCKVGDKIRVVDGPLRDFEGLIVSVNKKRNCVAIQLGEGCVMNRIWCSVEYVELEEETGEPINSLII